MTTRRLLIAAAVAWAIAFAGLVWMLAIAGVRTADQLGFLIAGDPVIAGCMVVSGLMGLVGVVGAVRGDRAKLLIGTGEAFVWGAVGALLIEATFRYRLINMNPPIPFAIDAVDHAQALAALLIGLTGVVVALAVVRFRHR